MTTTNRLDRLIDYKLIRFDARAAAQFPDGFGQNPWPLDSDEWTDWVREFNRELERIAARQALADGRLAAFEEVEDAKEVQRSVWQRLWDLFFNTRS